MNRRRAGFTLVELIVVVAILAALAGLVISKVDWVRRQANMAVGAESCGDVAQNIQTYIAMTETLPNGLDSLLDTSGNVYSGPAAASGSGGIIGITDDVGNLPSQLTSNSIGDKRINSLFRLGMRTMNNHSPTSTDATNSGTVSFSLGIATSTGSSLNTVSLALVNANGSIWNSIYPTQLWGTQSGNTMTVDATGTTVSLVAMGVGPNNSLIGATMTAPPQYPGPNSNIYYYRYIPIFAIYSDGRRAQLKGVVDPFGRTLASSLSQFSASGPDFLPPGVSRTPE